MLFYIRFSFSSTVRQRRSASGICEGSILSSKKVLFFSRENSLACIALPCPAVGQSESSAPRVTCPACKGLLSARASNAPPCTSQVDILFFQEQAPMPFAPQPGPNDASMPRAEDSISHAPDVVPSP